MCHDAESGAMASSFTSFLAAWEKLCYIGPEFWVLRPYLDRKKNLNGDSKEALRVRRLFGVARPHREE
jgi:hypothetical protein